MKREEIIQQAIENTKAFVEQVKIHQGPITGLAAKAVIMAKLDVLCGLISDDTHNVVKAFSCLTTDMIQLARAADLARLSIEDIRNADGTDETLNIIQHCTDHLTEAVRRVREAE